MTIWTSRSQLEDYERCPRLAYWRYWYAGTGIEGLGLQLEAEIGTAIHTGIESLLSGSDIVVAVADALSYMARVLSTDPVEPHLNTPQRAFELEESLPLVEVCVRGWALTRLPRLLADGVCEATEKEFPIRFSIGGEQVGIQTRADVLWRRTRDGALFIRNIKTTKVADDRWRQQWKTDMQTLSEPLAVESVLGETVSGVIMEAVCKGRKLEFPQSARSELVGLYYHNNPLLYGWVKVGEPPFTDDDWRTRYEWADASGKHRLGPGYRKLPVWRHYPGGVEAWVRKVWLEDAAAVDEMFVELEPILRSPYEIERWKRQTLHGIYDHRAAATVVELHRREGHDIEPHLDGAFPMHTSRGNCIWPRQCTYYGICHGAVTEPLASGLYQPRTPHHPVPEDDNA